MGRELGSLNFSGNFEVGAQAPFDARIVVESQTDLTNSVTYNSNAYNGMIVSVTGDNTVWMLKNKEDITNKASWVRIDAGAAGTADDVITTDDIGNGLQVSGEKLTLKTDSSGNVNLSVSANGLKAEFQNPVKGVLGSDKFLTLSSTLISATVGLDYEAESNKIRLLGKAGAVVAEVDASPFTKDEKLQSVTMVNGTGDISDTGKVIRFTVGSGDDTETVDLQLSQLFTWGNGLSYNNTNGTVALKLDSSSEPYLTITSAGIKLSGIDDAIAEAIQEVSGGIVASVTATANKGIEVAGTTTNPTIGLKIDNTGGVSLSTSANGLKADLGDIPDNLEKLLMDGEKVLSINRTSAGRYAFQTTLGLDYDSGQKQIKLTGADSAVIATIDASDFIKDGMVQSVELEGDDLVFTFNTDAGAEQITVDLSKFIDVYTQGNGIAITGKSISVKVDASSEDYLTVGTGGIKLSGIDAAIEAAITETFSWHEVGE